MNRILWWTGTAIVASLLCFGLAAAQGCTLRTAQRATVALDADVDDGLGGTGIESGDVRGAADQIARALAHDLKSNSSSSGRGARVAVMPVVNRTRFRIDPALVQNHLVHDLMQQSRKRFTLVAVRQADGAVRGGASSSPTANAVLKTELRSLTKDNGEVTSDYVEYWFALEDAVDGTILWSGLYETKRASAIDVVYQ